MSLREHLVLVVELPAALVHGALVERREADAVELAREREVDHELQRLAGEPARFRGRRALLEPGRVDVAEVQHRQLLATASARRRRPERRGSASSTPASRMPSSSTRRSPITTTLRSLRRRAGGEQLGADLGADAGDVAEHEADGDWLVS